ncbi:hypothetical protein EGI22_12480 [Lacihabitans sp. LS3-19]|uniref:hypothetical protein n=1 Tax=Lacihabitans sp. LS3-19 TaxID=2487335 RepID=UPI0020CDB810|nr:hypothetical protein [Lacihabitans sp. LS3-19]MCP9768734.1 hypothetical protein [Lacihabitans sp. LS3-19]
MKNIYVSLLFFLILVKANGQSCTTGCTYTYSGIAPNNSTNLNLDPGQTLCITGNAPNLNVNSNGAGNRYICVATGVTWDQSTLGINEATYNVYGTINTSGLQGNGNRAMEIFSGGALNLSGDVYANNQITLVNNGTLNFNSVNPQTMAGINLTNGGAITKVNGQLKIGNGSFVTTTGTIDVAALENEEANSFVNSGSINIAGLFNNHGSFTNNGTVDAAGLIVGNKGPGKILTNNANITITGDVTIQSSIVNTGGFDIFGNFTQNNLNVSGDDTGYFLVTGTISSTSGTITGTTVFTSEAALLASTTPVFPVKIINFNAIQIKEGINVSWEFVEASGFDKFELERSKDAVNFERIANLKLKDYINNSFLDFVDIYPIKGNNYYRLKMVNLDGSFEFSKIINVNYQENGEYVYLENPAVGQSVRVFSNIKKPNVKVVDMLGRTVDFKLNNMADGFNITPKRYFYDLLIVTISNENVRFVKKVILN